MSIQSYISEQNAIRSHYGMAIVLPGSEASSGANVVFDLLNKESVQNHISFSNSSFNIIYGNGDIRVDSNGIIKIRSHYDDSVTEFSNIAGIVSTEGVVRFILDSSGSEIARLYQAAFKRTPDEAGLDYWLGQKASGMSMADIAHSFLISSEFTSLYGEFSTMEPQTIIDLMYKNVLNREPDGNGYRYWLDQMADGLTASDVFISFANSVENKQNASSWLINTSDAPFFDSNWLPQAGEAIESFTTTGFNDLSIVDHIDISDLGNPSTDENSVGIGRYDWADGASINIHGAYNAEYQLPSSNSYLEVNESSNVIFYFKDFDAVYDLSALGGKVSITMNDVQSGDFRLSTETAYAIGAQPASPESYTSENVNIIHNFDNNDVLQAFYDSNISESGDYQIFALEGAYSSTADIAETLNSKFEIPSAASPYIHVQNGSDLDIYVIGEFYEGLFGTNYRAGDANQNGLIDAKEIIPLYTLPYTSLDETITYFTPGLASESSAADYLFA
jgi:hypothetical protein